MTKKKLLGQVRNTLCQNNALITLNRLIPTGSDVTIQAPAASADTLNPLSVPFTFQCLPV